MAQERKIIEQFMLTKPNYLKYYTREVVMMKSIISFCVAFFIITFPAFAELDSQDLDKIRLIVKEEIAKVETELKTEIAKVETELKTEIAQSEKRMKEHVDTKFEAADTKFDSINNRINLVVGFVSGLMMLVVVTVGIPQVIIAWRGTMSVNKIRE